MTAKEAIKWNQALWRELNIPERAKDRESVGLGIEALKLIDDARNGQELNIMALLPGETEE